MGNTLKVKYKFGTWQVLEKKTFDLNNFLSHMKDGRKIISSSSSKQYLRKIVIFTDHRRLLLLILRYGKRLYFVCSKNDYSFFLIHGWNSNLMLSPLGHSRRGSPLKFVCTF